MFGDVLMRRLFIALTADGVTIRLGVMRSRFDVFYAPFLDEFCKFLRSKLESSVGPDADRVAEVDEIVP